METIVTNVDNNTILFSSGIIENVTESLNLDDPSLFTYTSYLLDENGEKTNSVTDAFDIERHMLTSVFNFLEEMLVKFSVLEFDFSSNSLDSNCYSLP